MAKNETILRFEDVDFNYGHNKPILEEVNFSVRSGSKITIMGQNGAGKSTIFGLITEDHEPEDGNINIVKGNSIAIARQVIPRDELELTVMEFFEKCFDEKVYDIEPKINKILEVVNLNAPHDRIVGSFSGGQQARLLLASALIQDPDLLLLDEPTNNLDKEGIAHLTDFLINYKKTVIVISHEADFLNAFTDGVLYLDVRTRKVEQYKGNYFNVVEDIKARVEKENRKNSRLSKTIQEKKDKANFFANKGGQMRILARRMRDAAAEMEESKVDVRQEDKPIRSFRIPAQKELPGVVLKIDSYKSIIDHKPTEKKCDVGIRKNQHLLLVGPNGIGKSTLLEAIVDGTAKGVKISDSTNIGYYRQDFSTLNFDDSVYKCLLSAMDIPNEQEMRSVAAGFLLGGDVMNTKVGAVSEGQKGLISFAKLILQKPGLLILDEPTNHINFRHLPVIAEALDKYEGAMVMVSHVPDFVEKIRIDETLDLGK